LKMFTYTNKIKCNLVFKTIFFFSLGSIFKNFLKYFDAHESIKTLKQS
jgi:hypothetical protein